MIFQKWFSVELSTITAALFKVFLRDNGIRFESSGCYNLVHFQIFIKDEKDYNACNSFLEFLP